MRVILNQLVALGVKTGVGHYTAQLLRCLTQAANGIEIDRFPTGWVSAAASLYARLQSAEGERGTRNAERGTISSALRVPRSALWDLLGRRFQRRCSRGRYDLYHEPNYIPLPTDCPTVVTLHDLSVLLHPEWHPAERVAQFERHFPGVLQRCAHFITVSEFVRQEVIRKLGIASERVSRVYNGIRPELGPLPESVVAARLKKLRLPPSFLLYVGTIEPRKNLLRVLQAYCAVPETLRRQWPLVLVGGWGWNAHEVAEYLDSTARARGVQHAGYLSDRDLPIVYNAARALVYPSRYEGFGLPPLEMMACGGAVLASTAGALIETVGQRAHLVHADDTDGWRRALIRVVTDDDWWRALRANAAAVARPFTWERCAADTVRVYRTVCGKLPIFERQIPPFRAAG